MLAACVNDIRRHRMCTDVTSEDICCHRMCTDVIVNTSVDIRCAPMSPVITSANIGCHQYALSRHPLISDVPDFSKKTCLTRSRAAAPATTRGAWYVARARMHATAGPWGKFDFNDQWRTTARRHGQARRCMDQHGTAHASRTRSPTHAFPACSIKPPGTIY
jgi:hypothetical protein